MVRMSRDNFIKAKGEQEELGLSFQAAHKSSVISELIPQAEGMIRSQCLAHLGLPTSQNCFCQMSLELLAPALP